VIKFKLIYDKFFRENPEGSVKIIIPDDSIPTIDLRLTTYRVMDKVQLEQSDEILAVTKSQLGQEVSLGLTPLNGLEVGSHTTRLLFSFCPKIHNSLRCS